jgi:hypothetical protein
MINAILLLFSPGPTWKRLASANRPTWAVLLFSFLPVVLISCGLQAWALWKYGTHNASVQRTQHISEILATRFGTAQLVLGVVSLFFSAILIRNITKGTSIRTNFSTCLKATAYSLSSAFCVRIFDCWDFLNTWVVCGLEVVSLFTVLYTCMPNYIRPDPAKAFGLYVAAAVITSVCMAASHVFAYLVLQGTLFPNGFGWGLMGF